MSVVSMVVGAATESSARVVTKVSSGANVRLLVADNPGMSGPAYYGPITPNADNVAGLSATGLDPDSRYWYQIEHGAVIDTTYTGQIPTAPVLGEPASFEVAVAGDAGLVPDYPGIGAVLASTRLSNHPVFDTIRQRAPRAFIHLGDLHYYDLSTGSHGIVGGASLANYRRAYDDVLLQTNQHALYREVPWSYVWDDHDLLGNDRVGNDDPAGAANALQAWLERVPGYSLPNPSNGIHHSFQYGRVLFVMLDVRSNSSDNSDPDGPSKTRIGAVQKAWLDSLLASSVAEFLVIVSPTQWTLTTHTDSWNSFATERAELVTMFGDHGWLKRMCLIQADRHALGIESGSHNLHGGFPILMAASLDATPSTPADGDFDLGTDVPGRNQFGTIAVNDWGTGLTVKLTGWQGTVPWKSYTIGVNVSSSMTPTLLRTISGSHRATFEARVAEDYQTGGEPTGTEIPILSGDVALDGTADVRGTLELTTGGDDAPFPRGRDQLLAPYGNEVFVRRGVDRGSNGIEWVPLGYYRIEAAEQDDAHDGPVRVSGKDRMAGIIDGRLTEPRAFEPGRTVGSIFNELVLEIYPDAAIVFDDDTNQSQLARTLIAEESRYDVLRDIATAAGKIMYWDGAGMLQIKTAPEPTEPVWDVISGEDGVLVKAARRITREGVYNGVVASGEATDDTPPVRALVVDLGPSSPTVWGGRFGRVPRFYTSPFISTSLQAESAARSILRRAIGFPYSVDFSAVPNPALEPWDAVLVRYRNGDRDTHVIQAVTIPLTVNEPLTADTKEQRLIVLGTGQ